MAGYGCYIGNTFCGALAYPDDVTILGPSLMSLNLLLDVVNKFGDEYHVLFNASKTKLIKFGNFCETNDKEHVMLNSTYVQCESSACHLSTIIGKNVDLENIQSVHEFVANVSKLKAHFGKSSTFIKYRLLKAYCMPLYGCTLWDLSKKCVNRFYVTWRKSMRLLLNLPYNTHSHLLPYIVEDKPVELQLHMRFAKFFTNMHQSMNVLLKLCSKLASSGSCSSVSNNYVFIKQKYNVNDDFSNVNEKLGHSDRINLSVNDQIAVCNIQDLLYMRENSDSLLSSEELQVLLQYFCNRS